MIKHRRLTFNGLVFLGWLIAIALILLQHRSVVNYVNDLESLHIKVTELKHVVILSDPFRSQQLAKQTEITQEIHKLKSRIEQDFASHLFVPDSTDLLYMADQFLQTESNYVQMEQKLLGFIADFEQQKQKKDNSSQLNQFYSQMGSQLFKSFFNHNAGFKSYRFFDQMLEQSKTLPEPEAVALQSMLAKATQLLAQYSEVSYYVNKMKSTPLFEQIEVLHDELSRSQEWLLLLSALISLLAMVLIAANQSVGHNTNHQKDEQASLDHQTSELGKQSSSSEVSSAEPVSSTSATKVKASQSTVAEDESFHVTLSSLNSSSKNQASASTANQDKTAPQASKEPSFVFVSPTQSMPKEVAKPSPVSSSLTPSPNLETKTQPVQAVTSTSETSVSQQSTLSESASTVAVSISSEQQNSVLNENSQSSKPEPEQEKSFDAENMLETLGGDLESVEMLLDVFLMDHSQDAEKLNEMQTAQDKDGAIRIAHSLKGVAGTLGADHLREVASDIELTLKQGEWSSDDDIALFDKAIQAVVVDVKTYLSRIST